MSDAEVTTLLVITTLVGAFGAALLGAIIGGRATIRATERHWEYEEDAGFKNAIEEIGPVLDLVEVKHGTKHENPEEKNNLTRAINAALYRCKDENIMAMLLVLRTGVREELKGSPADWPTIKNVYNDLSEIVFGNPEADIPEYMKKWKEYYHS